MKYYLATKKNKIMTFSGKWMGLEKIILKYLSPRKTKTICSLSPVNVRSKSLGVSIKDGLITTTRRVERYS